MSSPTTYQETIDFLKAGNECFVKGTTSSHFNHNYINIKTLQPFAAILTCADTRLSPEIIFQQNIGDLFVVRVAGNIANPSTIGSLEFAVSAWDIKAIVVMGHTNCAAIQAAINNYQTPNLQSKNLYSIVDEILPLLQEEEKGGKEITMPKITLDHIQSVIHKIKTNSDIIAEKLETGKIKITGAHYLVENGEVHFQ